MGKAVITVVDQLPEKWSLFFYHEEFEFPVAEVCQDRFWFAVSESKRFEMTYQEALDSPTEFVRFVQNAFPLVARGDVEESFFRCLFNWADNWARRVYGRGLLGLVLETHPHFFEFNVDQLMGRKRRLHHADY